jgi:hypothetical protein
MVASTYFLACRIFEDGGFRGRLRAVPEDEEGIDLNFLQQELEKISDSDFICDPGPPVNDKFLCV